MPYVGREKYPKYKEALLNEDFSALWTDFYQLTMAQALFGVGLHNKITTFQYFIRTLPFEGQPLFTGGQNIIHEYLDRFFKFTDDDIEYLSEQTLPGTDVKIFQIPGFLDFLRNMKNELTIDAMPEGEVAFPNQPIMRVTGPVYQCMLIESAILNACNSQSLFVTLATMFRRSVEECPLIEGALRRTQSIGGREATRAGAIGGFNTTSNTMAGKNYGLKSSGTMAHSFIMFHENELEAIDHWLVTSGHMPLFLVDTYDTLEGVKRAIKMCKEKNITLSGIRLDSGDLAYLSIKARELLDEAGFTNATIVASNDLDVKTILSLREQQAEIRRYLVGTNFGVSKDQPALGGVYKIVAVYDEELEHSDVLQLITNVQEGLVSKEDAMLHVQNKMKLSENAIKMTYPGATDVIRILDDNGKFLGDVIVPFIDKAFVKDGKLTRNVISVNPANPVYSKEFKAGTKAYLPLSRVFEIANLVGDIETVHEGHERCMDRLKNRFDPSHLRLIKPHTYGVGVEEGLLEKQSHMARQLKREGFIPRSV